MAGNLKGQIERASGASTDLITIVPAMTTPEMHRLQDLISHAFDSRRMPVGGPAHVKKHHLFGKWHGPVWDRVLLWNVDAAAVLELLERFGYEGRERSLVDSDPYAGLSRLNPFSPEFVRAQLVARFNDHDPVQALIDMHQ